MFNPRSMAVLIRNLTTNQFEMRDVSEIRAADDQIEIVFTKSNKHYRYRRERVRILSSPQRRTLAKDERVEANGTVWTTATEVLTFTSTDGAWSRIFYRKQGRRGLSNLSRFPGARHNLGD